LLRVELARRLEPDGRRVVESEAPALAVFTKSLSPEFAATAELVLVGRVPDRAPVRINQLLIGVCYEPLRRLWAALGQNSLAALEERIDELAQRPPNWRVNVASTDDVANAVDELGSLILTHAGAFAEPYATIDRLLAEHRDDTGEFGVMVPLLLAAAGRIDEARVAMPSYRPHDYEDVGPHEAALVHKFEAWLEHVEPATQPE
jgi:hypothetical protein